MGTYVKCCRIDGTIVCVCVFLGMMEVGRGGGIKNQNRLIKGGKKGLLYFNIYTIKCRVLLIITTTTATTATILFVSCNIGGCNSFGPFFPFLIREYPK